jgi:hypothetical protein
MRSHHIERVVSQGKESGKYCDHSLMITSRYARSFNVEREVWRVVIRRLRRALALTMQPGSASVERVAQIVFIIEGTALKANAPD